MARHTPRALLGNCPLAPLEARILLAHVLGWRRTQLITRDDETLTDPSVAEFTQLVARRQAGEPIAQLVGEREFHGLSFLVTPDVLIPRPETELLVEQALASVAACRAPRVLDLGTGSGAVALAIAHARGDAVVVATDRSREALAVAKRNAARLLAPRPAGRVRWCRGDWWDALSGLADSDAGPCIFDVIASNPPYIPAHDPHLRQGDLRFEPRDALTDHGDGLRALTVIVAGAPAWLGAGGAIWLEHGHDQAEAVRDLLGAHGFEAIRSARDLAGIERVSGGRLRPGKSAII